jgi:FkbM family methyltransferase
LTREFRVIEGTIRDHPDKDECWLFNLAKNHKVIFDIGANIGQSALLMLYHDSVEKVVLVDANPEALSFAAENLIMNNLSARACFVPAFVSNTIGEHVELYTVLSGAAGSKYKSFARTASRLDAHLTAPTLTIDHLCDFFSLQPSLVKIDVEGAEAEVLDGAVQLARKACTEFLVEVHSGSELSMTENTNSILSWCENNSYTAWYLRDKQYLDVEVVKHRGGYHALLLPQTSCFPECLLDIQESQRIS